MLRMAAGIILGLIDWVHVLPSACCGPSQAQQRESFDHTVQHYLAHMPQYVRRDKHLLTMNTETIRRFEFGSISATRFTPS